MINIARHILFVCSIGMTIAEPKLAWLIIVILWGNSLFDNQLIDKKNTLIKQQHEMIENQNELILDKTL